MGSFPFEEHDCRVPSLMLQMGSFPLEEQMGSFPLEEPERVPSSWLPSMRSDLEAVHPKPAPQNMSFRNDKRGSMAMQNGKLLTTSQRRSAAGPWMRSTTVEPEGLGVGHLTYGTARLRASLAMTWLSQPADETCPHALARGLSACHQ